MVLKCLMLPLLSIKQTENTGTFKIPKSYINSLKPTYRRLSPAGGGAGGGRGGGGGGREEEGEEEEEEVSSRIHHEFVTRLHSSQSLVAQNGSIHCLNSVFQNSQIM